MKTLLGGLLLLVGCTTAEVGSESPHHAEAGIAEVDSARTADVGTTTRTYFLIPSQALIDAEYDIQRNRLENIGVSESQLHRWAFEEAVGMIGDMLDQKYGDHVQGEILPSTRMIIVKSDQDIDLSLLKDLVEDLESQ